MASSVDLLNSTNEAARKVSEVLKSSKIDDDDDDNE